MPPSVHTYLGAVVAAEPLDLMLRSFTELKENYHLSRHRPAELDGGRFAEAMFRVLESYVASDDAFTPFSRSLPRMDKLLVKFEALPSASTHESVRVHIPRVLQIVYGVRNRRDVGHIGGDVSPNLADATLVVVLCDWALAELVRLTYSGDLESAQHVVDDLVERQAPVVEPINGFMKLLRPELSVPDRILVLLYHVGSGGASEADLSTWTKPSSRTAFASALSRLDKDARIHRSGGRSTITRLGMPYVEKYIDLTVPLTRVSPEPARGLRKPARRVRGKDRRSGATP